MFAGIHDSLLTGYSVNSETQELVLWMQPHQESAPSPFHVVFNGVAAHFFEAPLLPAVLSDIASVSAERLVAEQWHSLERGYTSCGWPGPWADTLAHATQFVQSSSLQAFRVESSYGLSGWVLARSATFHANGL